MHLGQQVIGTYGSYIRCEHSITYKVVNHYVVYLETNVTLCVDSNQKYIYSDKNYKIYEF